MGVVHTGGETDLSFESVDEHLALEARRCGTDLDGNRALDLGVQSAEYNGSAAPTGQFFQDEAIAAGASEGLSRPE